VDRMVRKQIYITPAQERLLKQHARALGITESELIRRGVSQISRAPAAVPLDERAWQEELAFIHKRVHKKALGRSRTWTREELYDERLQRLSR